MFDSPVMGVDPGLTRCGWGIVATGDASTHGSGRPSAVRNRSTPHAVAHGVIGSPPDMAIGDRLRTLRDAVVALLAEYRPAAVALERVLFNLNVRTAMATGQAAGIVLLACADAGVPVATYPPTQVKLAVTGSGAADKKQMRHAVTAVLRLDAEPRTDAADALALALCHLSSAPLAAAVVATAAAPGAGRGSDRLRRAIADAVAADDAARTARRGSP
jgi:crossover junction endodeoxyribonuclease RuvC